MSFWEYSDDDFDAATLQEINAIEAAALGGAQVPHAPLKGWQQAGTLLAPAPLESDSDSSTDMDFDMDESAFAQMDEVVALAYRDRARPVAETMRQSIPGSITSGGASWQLMSGSRSSAPVQPPHQVSKPQCGSNAVGKPELKPKIWGLHGSPQLETGK
jgi:hypothetical protein